MTKPLDLVTLGPAWLTLRSLQTGDLDTARSFEAIPSGRAAITAIAAARLGLSSGLVTRLGDDPAGRRLCSELARERVDTSHIAQAKGPTLISLGAQPAPETLLTEDDVHPDNLHHGRAILVSARLLSHPVLGAATQAAMANLAADGMGLALDLDDLEEPFDGAEIFPLFDLILGSATAYQAATGADTLPEALYAVRAASEATLITGSLALDGALPEDLGPETSSPLAPAYVAGVLKGWLAGEAWEVTLRYAEACAATGTLPSPHEVEHLLEGKPQAQLDQLHWATTRQPDWPEVRIFAFDHRMQLEELPGASPEKIGRFKSLCLKAAEQVADGRAGYGFLCDSRLGATALAQASGLGLWTGRPVEWPGSRPLRLEPEIGPDFGGLANWARDHVVKVLCFCHPEDDAAIWADHEDTILRLFHAARRNRLEFLLEVIPSKVGPVEDDTTARLIQRFYDLGVYPDWWKLEPMGSPEAWRLTSEAITRNDPHTRGIVILGLGESEATLAASFRAAATTPLVKGFAVGRTIFAQSAEAWMRGEMEDDRAVAEMAETYARLCGIWDEARRETHG